MLLGGERNHALQRWLRGREEYIALQDSSTAVVSFGKSGRTWLRAMMTHYYRNKFGLETTQLLEFDNLHNINPNIPKIFFTHDNYIRFYCKSLDSKRYFQGKNVILLARNPIDVAVSQYFHWKHRMSATTKALNWYPNEGIDMTLEAFIFMDECGLPEIIRYMNIWAGEFSKLDNAVLIRYEDMKKDPLQSLSTALKFTGSDCTTNEAQKAVEQSSFDRMKNMESSDANASSRLSTKAKGDPNAFKVRKGKVGGYKDYFDATTVRRLEQYCDLNLAIFYGYDFGYRENATPQCHTKPA